MIEKEKSREKHLRALAIVKDSLMNVYMQKEYYAKSGTAGELLDAVVEEFLENRIARASVMRTSLRNMR